MKLPVNRHKNNKLSRVCILYTIIVYFDEDMCETELTSDEALHIDKDSIKKITTTCDNEADSTESSVEEESSGTGWLW